MLCFQHLKHGPLDSDCIRYAIRKRHKFLFKSYLLKCKLKMYFHCIIFLLLSVFHQHSESGLGDNSRRIRHH